MRIFLKFLLPTFVLIFMLSSCGDSSTLDAGNQKEFITDSAPQEDSVSVIDISIPAEISLELEKYFLPELCAKLNQYVIDFNNLESDLDFEKNYREGRSLSKEMYLQLNEPKTSYLKKLANGRDYWNPIEVIYDDLSVFENQLGPIVISCVAECSEVDLLFDLNLMKSMAEKTTGTGDDDFIDLVIFCDGDYGYAGYPGFKSWFKQTWDYGGASLLGGRILIDAINETIAYQKNFKLFDAELALVRKDFVDELTWGGAFQYTPEKILKEFDAILALKYFTKIELVEIMIMYDKIKNQDPGMQFDCENQDCSYG